MSAPPIDAKAPAELELDGRGMNNQVGAQLIDGDVTSVAADTMTRIAALRAYAEDWTENQWVAGQLRDLADLLETRDTAVRNVLRKVS